MVMNRMSQTMKKPLNGTQKLLNKTMREHKFSSRFAMHSEKV